MDRTGKENRWLNRPVIFIVSIWLATTLVMGLCYLDTHRLLRTVEELESSAEDLRATLSLSQPYRSVGSNNIALSIQLIYSLRLQLEAENKRYFYNPDLTQLLYVTDRFISQTQAYLAIENNLHQLVDSLSEVRRQSRQNDELHNIYLSIGAYLFDALFSNQVATPEAYRAMDRLYVQSLSFPEEERRTLQKILAQANSVLSSYAEGDDLVEKLLQNSIYQQTTSIDLELYHLFRTGIMIHLAISFIAILLVWYFAGHFPGRVTRNRYLNWGGRNVGEAAVPEGEEISGDRPESRPGSVQTGIDIDQMMNSLNDDQDSVRLLLNVFIQDHEQDDKKLIELLNSDLIAAERQAHTLKGIAGNLGAVALMQTALDVEMALKNGETPTEPQLTALFSSLADAIESARFYLHQEDLHQEVLM